MSVGAVSSDSATKGSNKRRKLSHSEVPEKRPRNKGTEDSDVTRKVSDATVSCSNHGSAGNGSETSPTRSEPMISTPSANLLNRTRKLVESISQTIKSIPSTQKFAFAEAEKYAESKLGVSIPWSPRPASDIKYTFGFEKPDKVVYTSFEQRTNGSSTQLYVQMPEILFQEKDYLNYRALQKRSFYLACLAGALKKSSKPQFSLHYAFKDDNDLLPVLNINIKSSTPNGESHEPMLIGVTPVFPSSLGSVDKMLPSSNCLRSISSATADSMGQTESSAFYNSSIALMGSILDIEQLFQQTQAKSDAFEDACMLGSKWLEQNGLTSNVTDGGFGNFEWSYMCAVLLTSGGHRSQPLFSTRYTSMQLFKAMMQVLSSKDFTEPFVVRGEVKVSHQDETPILLDAETGVNVFYKVQPWSYVKLKACASSTAALLKSKADHSSPTSLGLNVSTPALEYDETYTIQMPSKSKADKRSTTLHDLHATLSKACGDRIKTIQLRPSSLPAWAITGVPVPAGTNDVLVGLTLNADHAVRTIDRGPSVEDKAATEDFRRFWGEKAELRKFVDAGIVECLVWTLDESVTKQIIKYSIQRHFGIEPDKIQCSAQTEALELPRPLTAAASAYKLFQDQFQDLSDKLRNLQELPLQLRSIIAADPALRSGTVVPIASGKPPSPMSILIELDTSGRWPESLAAINYTKMAFLAKIGDLLSQVDSKISATVGVENTNTSKAEYLNDVFLDLTYAAAAPGMMPFTFRLRINHSPIEALLQKLLQQKSLTGAKREQLQMALHTHRRNFIAAPAHHTAIKNLITQFAPLSPTIRLLKKWIGSHNLTTCIPAELLEILCASVFLNPHPWPTPGSATTAFLRVLHFISTWDWAATPLIVDLSLSQDAINAEQRQELMTRFTAWRNLDPGMNNVTLFVATNIDGTGVVWTQMAGTGTQPKPEKVVASRVQALATAALNEVSQADKLLNESVIRSVFTADLDDYDFVLYLDPAVTGQANSRHNSRKQFKNLQIQAQLDVDAKGVNFAQAYLAELEQAFAEVAIFFCGGTEQSTSAICGLWRPHVRKAREWKIRLGFSSVPVSQGDADATEVAPCNININGILSEMAMLGEGIVTKVRRKDDD